MNVSVTVAILAGGRSYRMGSDKSVMSLHGRPLIQHVVERVAPLALPTILISNDPERHEFLGLPTFADVVPAQGSLGGMYSALYHSETDYTVCVACDMPFVSPALLVQLITLRKGFDAVVPVVDGRPQGLHAVYHKACSPTMLRALQQDRLKISEFLRGIQARFVEEATLRRFDPNLRSFTNVNTPEDLRQAEESHRM